MVYLAKGGFWLTGSKVINSAVAFGLAIAYANLLSQETYGQYKYILSIASLVGITALTGMDTSLVRSIIKGYEGSLKNVIKLRIKWGFWGMFIGFAISAYYFINENNIMAASIFIAAILSPLINAIVYNPYFEGKKLFKTLSKYSAINQVFVAILIIGSLIIFPNIIFLIFIYFFSNFLIQLILLIRTYKKYKPNDKIDPDTISFGKHLSAMNILSLVANQFDKILTWHFLGPIQLAIYSFATIPATQIQSLLKPLSIMAFPKISEQDIETTKKTLPKKVLKFWGFLILIIIVYILLSPIFYKLFFREYTDAIKYSWLFSLSLFSFPMRLFSYPLIAHAKHKDLYITNLINPVTKIIFLSIFLPLYGIWGAIFAILSATLISDAFLYYKFTKI